MIRQTLAAFLAAFMLLGAMPIGSATEANYDEATAHLIPGDWPAARTDEEWRVSHHEPDLSTKPAPQNKLVIDSATGTIIEHEDIGAKLTEVRVRGVVPEGTSYQLYAPDGFHVHVDSKATPGGELVFPWVLMKSGTWVVTQRLADAREIIVSEFAPQDGSVLGGVVALIFPTSKPDLFGASYSTRQQRTYGGSGSSGGGGQCGVSYWYRSDTDKQIPLAFLHSPFGGSSEQHVNYDNTDTYVWGPYGVSSSTVTGFGLTSTSGETQLYWKQARFHSYKWVDSCSGQSGYVAYISYWHNVRGPAAVGGSSKVTDQDDLTQFGNSIRFDHRYYTADHIFDGAWSSSGWNEYVRNSYTTTFAGEVDLSIGRLSLGIEARAMEGVEWQYVYHFPAEGGNDYWYGEEMRYGGQSFSFCRPIYGTIC